MSELPSLVVLSPISSSSAGTDPESSIFPVWVGSTVVAVSIGLDIPLVVAPPLMLPPLPVSDEVGLLTVAVGGLAANEGEVVISLAVGVAVAISGTLELAVVTVLWSAHFLSCFDRAPVVAHAVSPELE